MTVAAARAVERALRDLASKDAIPAVARYFHADETWAGDNRVLGVPMPKVFPVAKAHHKEVSLTGIERLLESRYYEVRMAGVSIMDAQVRPRSAGDALKGDLHELYLRRHDRINSWDLVDRAAPHVVGAYLLERPRDVLDELAGSDNPWERRTAVVATAAFLRAGQLDDTFRLAEQLADDEHLYVQKALGSWVREAGKQDQGRLVAFLESHGHRLLREALRTATEKLPARKRDGLRERLGGRPS